MARTVRLPGNTCQMLTGCQLPPPAPPARTTPLPASACHLKPPSSSALTTACALPASQVRASASATASGPVPLRGAVPEPVQFDVPAALPLNLLPTSHAWTEVAGGVCAPRGFQAQGEGLMARGWRPRRGRQLLAHRGLCSELRELPTATLLCFEPRQLPPAGAYAGLRDSSHRADLALLVSNREALVACVPGAGEAPAPAVDLNRERLAACPTAKAVLMTASDGGPHRN